MSNVSFIIDIDLQLRPINLLIMYDRKLKSIPVLLVAILAFTSLQDAQAQREITVSALAKLDSMVENYPESEPGFVLAVSHKGKMIYERAAGKASLELGLPMNTDAVFEAASVSKQFTATTVLKLAERGLISLDDDIRKYIPELADFGHTITIRHLLTMTSGLRDWRNITYLTGPATFSAFYNSSEAFEIITKQNTLNFPPGERYSYSNTNYDLLNILVYRVTKTPFIEYSTKEVLDPVGMIGSSWRADPHRIVKNRVDSYRKVPGTSDYQRQYLIEMTHGAAGLYVTARDLVKWADFWAENGFGEQLSSWRNEVGVLNSGRLINYSLGGVRLTDRRGALEISHSGLLAGFRAWVSHYPDAGLSISCLTNTRDFEMSKVQSAIVDVVTGTVEARPTREQQEESGSAFKSYAGLYKGIDNFNYFELVADGKYAIIGKDTLHSVGTDVPGFSKINSTYYIPRAGQIEFQNADEHLHYRKVQKWTPGEQELEKFVGRYYSPELDLTFEIINSKDGIFAVRNKIDRLKLLPRYIDGDEVGFYTASNGLRTLFSFTQLSNKNAPKLTVSIPRAENFVFKRLKNQ